MQCMALHAPHASFMTIYTSLSDQAMVMWRLTCPTHAETQFLLMQTREDGPYVILLPLIDSGTFRATLRPTLADSSANELSLRIESGDAAVKASTWKQALYIAAGSDPFALLDAAVAKAAALSGGAKPL